MVKEDTPLMRQYTAAKAQHPDAIVFLRMGDFYEMWGDDAIAGSEAMQITLTRRRSAKEGDEGIPMCGVPHHAAEGYIGKLLQQGFKVALVEQMESPEEAKKARGSGAVVRREVVRLFTPGTLTEDAYLGGNAAKYLVSVGFNSGGERPEGAVSWLDMSTGDVGVRVVTGANVASVLAALPIGEIVVGDHVDEAWLAGISRRLVNAQSGLFARSTAEAAIKRAYGVGDLGGLGLPNDAAIATVGALIGYAELTQVGKLPGLRMPAVVTGRSRMSIDPSTRKNLELTESLGGKRADSLLGILDKCVTGAGARLLARWVAEPLLDVSEITRRQDAVAQLAAPALRTQVRDLLRDTGDVARCVSRLLLGRGGPRDLGVLRATGAALPKLQNALAGCDGLLKVQVEGMAGLEPLTELLSRALAEEPLPALVRDGGFVADGYDTDLDAYRVLVTDGNRLLQELEARESASGIPLKLRYNQVWGYYLEITKQHESKVPSHWLHRQTTTQTHRYSTPELMSLERELGSAGAKAQKREEEILAQLVDGVRGASYPLLSASEALATLDVLAGMAEVAVRHGWVRPVVDDSSAFVIEGGCHPVVSSKVSEFVPNGCELSGGQLWLLTGPNMAGKSTFLRQNALLTILAQMGSFVPAKAAHIGVADAVFSRIGAADDLAAGQSTFMVEMVETAQILNRATSRSLVILDELGRGTATYDGLAIAWACVEDVVSRIGCRTLFATHYHELTALEAQMDNVSCWQVAVREWKGEIVFLHEVKRGAAAGSYGVQVAKLAGVPNQVVKRADSLLDGFLKVARNKGVVRVDELSLFSAPVATPVALMKTEVEERLKGLDVDGLSAREALEELYKLRGMVN
ncbi:MAG: DNA mismatch repair protein MutS [Pseudomonas fluorescens]|nr:MAG: DNA mismatch repair protein MutS [Pseudomonas fluorescens]